MKTILAFILLGLVQVSLGGIVTDFDSLLSEQEIQSLKERVDNLQKKYHYTFFIYFSSDPSVIPEPPTKNQIRSLVIQVFINRTDTTCKVRTVNIGRLNNRFFRNIFFQFTEVPMKEGRNEYQSLLSTLDETEKELERRRIAREQSFQESEFSRKMDPRAKMILWIFLFIFTYFIILFTVKGAKAGNRFEVLEFYGLSRLPLSLTMLLGLIVFLTSGFLILQKLTNGSWIVIGALLFVLYPVMVALGWLIKVIQDSFLIPQYGKDQVNMTLGQMLWLIRPQTSTEHMMEVTFYEQILRRRIQLEVQTAEINRREVYQYWVALDGPIDLNESYKRDEEVFIKELNRKQETLQPYLRRIYKNFGRFKAYRKDYVLKSLYLSGLISKHGWPVNYFSLSQKGLELQQKIKQVESEQSTLISKGIDDPSGIEQILPKLTPHVLLIDNFEKRLTTFYNAVVDMGLLQQAMSLPIGFLFHPDFSLRTFNLKLVAAYKYRIHWEDMIDESAMTGPGL